MNRPKLKLFGGILILAVLGIMFGGFLLGLNAVVNGFYDLKSQAAKMKAVSSSVTNVVDLGSSVMMQRLDEFTKRVGLASIASRGFVRNEWDGQPTNYHNGVIVTVSGGEIAYPDDYPEEKKIDASSLTDDFGIVYLEIKADAGEDKSGEEEKEEKENKDEKESNQDKEDDCYVVEYSKVKDNVYYIEAERASDLNESASRNYDMEKSMEAIEKAFGVKILLISNEVDEEGRHSLMYIADDLQGEGSTAEDCGITAVMLEQSFDSSASVTPEAMSGHSETLQLGGDTYNVYIQSVEGQKVLDAAGYFAYLVSGERSVQMTYEQTTVVLAAFLMIGIVLLVWFFSAFRLVRHYKLNEEQATGFRLGKMAKKAFSMTSVGCCLIIIVSALFLSLFRLVGVCSSVENSLKVLEQRIKQNTKQKTTTAEELKKTYAAYAEVIAQVLKEKPELATAETLKEFSELIGADYLMIFDHDGNEMISDSKYTDMVLGITPESSTYEFRRLLKGIPVVAHDVMTDEETGLTNAMIGVCLESAVVPGEYGALLVAVPKDKIAANNLESTNDVMKNLVSDGTFAFSVNPETKMIVNASDTALIGRNAVSLGLPEKALADSYRDFFAFSGMSCYGECKEIDGTLYYYAAEQSHIYKNVVRYSAIAAGTALLLLAALIGFMLFGYRKAFEHWSNTGEELEDLSDSVKESEDGMDFIRDPQDGLELLRDPKKEWKLSFSRYGLQTPMHNATVALELLLVATIVILGIHYLFRENNSGSLLSFVRYGHWTKGFNLFSFTSILILFGEVLIVVSVLKIIIRVISNALGTKGETFCRLAQNLITYGGVIVFVYLAVYNLGFDLGPLLASLSLPAFALSLGAKDLITDIVAGISIVFDGEYKVGEIIEVNGYRGKVLEIGVRTTKLQGSGNNIKIIYNRDIKNVLNMSRENSWCNLEIKISTERGLKEIEPILIEQLPKIGQNIQGILRGPIYRGITMLVAGGVTISIGAECNEADFSRIQRELNHAIQDLFDENGIQILK